MSIKFKKGFKEQKVEIDGKDEATYTFVTVPVTRSVEAELVETQEAVKEFDSSTTDEESLKVVLEMIDKLIKPVKGKRKLASEVLLELWKAEDCESLDVLEFLNRIAVNRRPS